MVQKFDEVLPSRVHLTRVMHKQNKAGSIEILLKTPPHIRIFPNTQIPYIQSYIVRKKIMTN